MIIFITFASSDLSPTIRRIKKEAKKSHFFNKIITYNEKSIDKKYYKKNKTFFESNRGFGFWLWKPYIIKEQLQRINEGDILIYLDAGCVINANGYKTFKKYIELLEEEEIICFDHIDCFENQYTKKEVIEYFKLSNKHPIMLSPQIHAGVILIKKTNRSLQIISEWHEIMNNHRNLIDDTLSPNGENPEFKACKHDQSIFSILCKINKIKILPQTEIYPKMKNWDKMIDKPFWAVRKKEYKKQNKITATFQQLNYYVNLIIKKMHNIK